ncbi:putative pterin-4-alpha-carbinolamine dehydratase [Bisporella sp. PMI_857]|nr:putative pterin-4-alpha-carbinolamine dehydratase [Bisporella sp. PMI_857]
MRTSPLFRHITAFTVTPKPAHHISRLRIRRMSTLPTAEPVFSSNYDPAQAGKDLLPLLLANGGKWALIESGKGVERSFKFKTFKKTWEFMNIVAAECAVQKHHPEWSNIYNTTFVRWTTHSPPGLSEKDVTMARFCDEQAEKCGEVEGDGSQVGKELADRVAMEGGDCCVPKKKVA